ncbi:MAG TPA: hypothetical protein VFA23_12420 [Dongiaceae bacterium]|nr:hypothetical protein [Dongiaceae bacterium]
MRSRLLGLAIWIAIAGAAGPAAAGTMVAQIVPPFTSFTPPMRPFPRPHPPAPPIAVPFPLWGWGDPYTAPSNISINVTPPAPAAPPPAPVVYNPPSAETTPAGVEVVRCMSTSPAKQ